MVEALETKEAANIIIGDDTFAEAMNPFEITTPKKTGTNESIKFETAFKVLAAVTKVLKSGSKTVAAAAIVKKLKKCRFCDKKDEQAAVIIVIAATAKKAVNGVL